MLRTSREGRRGEGGKRKKAIAVLPATMTKESGGLHEGNLIEPYPGVQQRAHGRRGRGRGGDFR